MENWIIYGLITSLCFGVNVIIYKIATTRGQGLNPFLAGFSFTIGVALFFLIVFLIKSPKFNNNWTGLGLAVLAGVIWSIGFFFVVLALANNADVSRLAPLFNTNTLVAVLLGIIVLKELPSSSAMLKVLLGSVFIVIGSILVSS